MSLLVKGFSFFRRSSLILCSLGYRFLLKFFFEGVRVGSGFRCGKGLYTSCTDGGRIDIGCNVCIGRNVKLIAQSGVIEIGDNAFIGDGSILVAKKGIEIGEDALIAEYVTIRDQNHMVSDKPFRACGFDVSPIHIEANVWLGTKSTVLKGVRIGDSSVVGAHALVIDDVDSDSLAVGVPAVVKKLKRSF